LNQLKKQVLNDAMIYCCDILQNINYKKTQKIRERQH